LDMVVVFRKTVLETPSGSVTVKPRNDYSTYLDGINSQNGLM
jgi:hypothetical protein